jgi:spore germination protein GerM
MMKKMMKTLLLLVLVGLLSSPGCTFLPEKTPVPGSTIVSLAPGAKIRVVLYFPDRDLRTLVKEERDAVRQNEMPYATALRELLRGSTSERASRSLPQGSALVSEPALARGVLFLNFNDAILRLSPENERIALQALVYTLTEYKEVTGVQILVDGDRYDSIAGIVTTSTALTRQSFSGPSQR